MSKTKPKQKPPQMLTSEEVCELLSISRETLTRIRTTKKLTSYRIGREYRFKQSDIEKYLEEQRA